MGTIVDWVSRIWDWLVDLNGFEGAAIALSLAALGYANGVRRDRRVASFKEVLAAEALFLHYLERSAAGRARGITVEHHLNPDPIPGPAWGRWQRFRGRWLQLNHLPWRVRHFACALLLWNGPYSFNVVLTWVSAPSRREAMNQVVSGYGYAELTADEFALIDRPGTDIVWPLDHLGYLILEPARPRRSWQRLRKAATRSTVNGGSSEPSTPPPTADGPDYSPCNNNQ